MQIFILRLRAICGLLGLLVFLSFFTPRMSNAQTDDSTGFDWYEEWQNVSGQQCAHSVYMTASGSYYRAFTPWTPPVAGFPAYEMKTFKAVLGSIDLGFGVLPPPSYPGYRLYIYDEYTHFMGSYIDDGTANSDYVMKYEFYPPYDGAVSFLETGATMYYPTGGGNVPVPMYELTFDLNKATSMDPVIPIYLQPGVTYWFSLVGVYNQPSNGFTCLGRANYLEFPSPEPSQPIILPMTEDQCNNWGQPFPCNFQLASQDYYRIGQPGGGDSLLCSRKESPVNTYDAIYEPHLPIPNCLSTEDLVVLPCCQRTFAGRWAVALDVTPATSACDGDANGDGMVDPLDAGYVQARYGCAVGIGDADCDAADVNLDGLVDPLDTGYVLARLGECGSLAQKAPGDPTPVKQRASSRIPD